MSAQLSIQICQTDYARQTSILCLYDWETIHLEVPFEITVRKEGGSNSRMLQINELTPETDYMVRVKAYNSAGTSTSQYEISTSPYKRGMYMSSVLVSSVSSSIQS